MDEDYVEAIRHQREQRERQFAESHHSPIPPDYRESFAGLDYYPVDPDYRFELELHEHDDPETISVETTTEGTREYLVWGEFRFEVDGEDVSLQAYRSDPDEEYLWVPFRDETSGEETYGAGRYLDLEEGHRTGDGQWILDFNAAYNPTCAYNAAYECPLVPVANWLEVPIEAGEKDYPGQPVEPERH